MFLSRKGDDEDEITPDATWNAGLTPYQPRQVYEKEQCRTKSKASSQSFGKQPLNPVKEHPVSAYGGSTTARPGRKGT
jgi:hypothetical protein